MKCSPIVRAIPKEVEGKARDWLCGGYTLIEVATALILFSIVLAAAHAVLLGQRRFYTASVLISDARDAARSAAEVLAGELRAVSPSAGDFYAIASDSVALRSTVGVGVVCAVSGNGVGLRRIAGSIGASPADSAMVFLERDPDSAFDDRWDVLPILRAGRGGGGLCPDGRLADLDLDFGGPAHGATIGSPLRAFRPYVYKLYAGPAGHWWLGRRLRGGVIQPVAGPFLAPADRGLRLEYVDDSGAPTWEPREVARVRIFLTARSQVPGAPSFVAKFFTDSIFTAVYLRNP